MYVKNLLPISYLLAEFEIYLEGFKKGEWSKTEFDHKFWGRKIMGRNKLSRFIIGWVLEKTYITPYHIVMFGGIIPLVTIINYLVLWLTSGQVPTLYGWLFMTVAGTKIFAPLFVVAVWIGNLVLEDFLWFALQSLTGWREPHALSKLLHGEFAWHTKWWGFKGLMLPRFYFTTPLLVTLILLAQHFIVMRFG